MDISFRPNIIFIVWDTVRADQCLHRANARIEIFKG